MTKFSDAGLSPEVQKAVEALGFEELTPIQEKTIPFLLNSEQDIIALAQTGTGKTAAFGLPVVDLIDPAQKGVQVLILCPTRELCIQISKDMQSYAKYLERLSIVPVYGGTDIRRQIKDLRRGAQIVVGTPGRVLDLIKRLDLDLSEVKYVVLDEADEMLNMGFQEDLDSILDETPKDKQSLLFSATMQPRVRSLAKKYLNNPEELTVARVNQGATNVSHEYFVVGHRFRYEALKRLVDINPGIYGIIFCRTRAETRDISESLMADGYNAEAIHGDLSQAQRDRVMARFRSGAVKLLVATDVAARGIDVDDISHIINFNLPDDPEVYIHRSGRTGRAGKSGLSLALVTPKEEYRIRRLEKLSGKTFVKKALPSGNDVVQAQLVLLIDKISDAKVDEEQIAPFMPVILEKWADMDRETLIRKILSLEFNRFLSYYKNSKDLNTTSDRGRTRDGKGKGKPVRNSRGFETNYKGFYVNMGSKRSLSPSKLIHLINEQTGDPEIGIGRIQIEKKVSYFEVEAEAAGKIVEAFDFATYQGNRLTIQEAEAPPRTERRRPERKRGFDSKKKHRKGPRRRR